jgi:hypothetical protein
MLFFRKLFVQ